MRKNSFPQMLVMVSALVSAPAFADDDAWSTFRGFLSSAPAGTGAAANSYLPNPNRYSSVSVDSSVAGTPEADAAYARRMRIAYAQDAVANSTATAEASMRQKALSNANCREIVTSADTAKKFYVARHMPPDPTKVIRSSTCFVDVLKIKIPRTGSAILDGLVGKLTDLASGPVCSATSDYWGKIATAAARGDVRGLTNTAITTVRDYVPQDVGPVISAIDPTGSPTTNTTAGSAGAQNPGQNISIGGAQIPALPPNVPANSSSGAGEPTSVLGAIGRWINP